MKQYIDEFCRYMDVERNVSPHTLTAYRNDLEMFREFVRKEQAGEESVEGVSHLTIRRFLASLARDMKKSTMGRKLAAIRSFYKFLVREGKARKNPAELVSTPRKEKKIPFHLDID